MPALGRRLDLAAFCDGLEGASAADLPAGTAVSSVAGARRRSGAAALAAADGDLFLAGAAAARLQGARQPWSAFLFADAEEVTLPASENDASSSSAACSSSTFPLSQPGQPGHCRLHQRAVSSAFLPEETLGLRPMADLERRGLGAAEAMPPHPPAPSRSATSFGHGGDDDGGLMEDAEKLTTLKGMKDPTAWIKLLTGVANWSALSLTLLASIYHAYGYVQYKGAVEQASNIHDDRDD
eukprot:TRINITY_DN60048_c0_g1_i1.p1 TRINITY_DN60048_c0_g1~~TRINITY_DN60048_c0_g1_i1.p1  ORF type:complete len:273 (-),score=59.95 TRINITY_DN60048_c0_g1_i1:73-789(-)